MKAKQADSISGRESAQPLSMHMCARPGARGITPLNPPLGTQKAILAVTVLDALHWAYAREQVHKARAPGLDACGFAPRGFAGTASSERVGAAVGSSMNLGFEAPRDAYAVKAAVDGCGQARLVREYALIGKAPDWTPYPEVWFEHGPPIYGRDERKRRIIIAYQVMARGDLDALVVERRANYRRWAVAVARVHAVLTEPGALVDRVLTDVLPPLEPWQRN